MDERPHHADPEMPAGRPVGEVRLDGGRPCLDFVNTIHDRHDPDGEDYIATPGRYIAWARRVVLIEPGEPIDLPATPAARRALMQDVRALRAHLHALFEAVIDGTPPSEASRRQLDRWLHAAWAGQTLAPGARGALAWSPAALDARLPLKRIALCALALLQMQAPGRLKRCRAQGRCGWLFLDTSRNGRRQWCAMDTCGTASKMARYRSRAAGH